MKEKILIENIFISLTKDKIINLPKFLFYLPKPSVNIKRLFDLVISTNVSLKYKTIVNVKKYLKKTNANVVIHLAGLSRPMSIHERSINKSI